MPRHGRGLVPHYPDRRSAVRALPVLPSGATERRTVSLSPTPRDVLAYCENEGWGTHPWELIEPADEARMFRLADGILAELADNGYAVVSLNVEQPKCPECEGRGWLAEPEFGTQTACPRCKGQGHSQSWDGQLSDIVVEPCPSCGGSGTAPKDAPHGA